MRQSLRDVFRAKKFVIAGVHFLPLPGSPDYDRRQGMKAIIERARLDTKILVENGVHGILFANEFDVPYLQAIGPETVAAFAAAVSDVTKEFTIPYGVNVLLDPVAGISIAHATGATFVRGYFAGGYVTDMGIMSTKGPEALRLRANLAAGNIKILHNLVCAFGVPFVERPKAEEAHGIKVHVGIDAFTVSGRAAGLSPDRETFQEVRQTMPDIPLIVGTGASSKNVESFFELADGAIVATALRKDDIISNSVDPERVKEFMSVVNRVNSSY